MKVGTDGVLMGAWASVDAKSKILDIGTGTGLIALMLAQRSKAWVYAIEIDGNAALQATENALESPWAERIHVIHSSFQNFRETVSSEYDLIVCNPPFFSKSLKTETHSRNLARHDDELSLRELVSGVAKLLRPDGLFALILPAEKEAEIQKETEMRSLFPKRIMRIRPTPSKPFKRVMMEFTFQKTEPSESEMCIETDKRHQYSTEYTELTKDFYL